MKESVIVSFSSRVHQERVVRLGGPQTSHQERKLSAEALALLVLVVSSPLAVFARARTLIRGRVSTRTDGVVFGMKPGKLL